MSGRHRNKTSNQKLAEFKKRSEKHIKCMDEILKKLREREDRKLAEKDVTCESVPLYVVEIEKKKAFREGVKFAELAHHMEITIK